MNDAPLSPSAGKHALGFIFVTLVMAIVGFGLLIPVLPKLVVQLQGGDPSAGAHTFGWLVSVYALMQFFGSPILGALSDRFGRRRIILIATAGSVLDYVIMALAPSLGWFFLARTLAGLTAGVLATANAYIVDVTPPEKRAQAFGLLGAAFGVGFIIGPLAGGVLGAIDLRLPFWAAAGCSAFNWFWGFFALPESLKPENRREFSWKRANPVGSLLALKRFPVVLGLVEVYFIIMMSHTMIHSIWALYTEHRYGWDPLHVGLSLAFVGIMTGLVQALLIKRIVPRLGDARSVLVGLGMSLIAQVCYGLASQGWMIYAFIVLGAFAGLAGPALQSYITKHVPPNEQGALQGILSGLGSLAGIPGPFIATFVFGWAIAPERTLHVPGLSFFVGAAMVLVALLFAARSFRRDASTPSQVPPAAPSSPSSASTQN